MQPNDDTSADDYTAESNERTKSEKYQDELSERVNSGGCTEVWEAAEEYRNLSRRKVIGVIGSLFAGTSAAKTVAAEKVNLPDEPDTQVNELKREEIKEVFQSAKRNNKFNRIFSELASQGLRPDVKSSKAYRASYQDEAWRFIRVPFESPSRGHTKTNLNGAVVWTEKNDVQPHGYLVKEEVKRGATPSKDIIQAFNQADISYSSNDTILVEISHTQISSDREGVSTDTNTRTVPVKKDPQSRSTKSDEGTSTQDLGDCACTAWSSHTLCIPCGTPDVGCVYDLANAYAAEVAACGLCVAPSGGEWAECVMCVATLIDNDEWVFCCWCDLWGPWDN